MLRPAIVAVATAALIGGSQAPSVSGYSHGATEGDIDGVSESVRTEVPVQGDSPISIAGIWKTDADCYDFPYIEGLAHPYVGFSDDGKFGVFGQKPDSASKPDQIYEYEVLDDDDLKIWSTNSGDQRPVAEISYVVTVEPDPLTETESVYHFKLTNNTVSSDVKYPQFRWQSCTLLSS